MLIKKLVLAGLTAAAITALPASANVTTSLDLTFGSGATFSGDLTFLDNYAGLIGVNGVLSGAGYGSDAITWTWWAGTGQANPQNYSGITNTYNDWLMDGSAPYSYSHYIGITWNYPANGQLSLVLSPDTGAYYAGVNGSDPITSYKSGSVPEPASLGLLAAGIVGLGFARRFVRK